ncbi:retrovirus-related pol polyprotein from transposon TNT 1-94 [Tanacetum coccineum]
MEKKDTLSSCSDSEIQQMQLIQDKTKESCMAVGSCNKKRYSALTARVFGTLCQRECRKPKRVKDYAYHKEKMMMCKQAEQGVPLQAEQADWLEDTDEEIDEQELEAHYSYMAKIQEVSPEETSSTSQPLEQVQNHDENDVFANMRRHSEQPESINDTYVLEKDDSIIAMGRLIAVGIFSDCTSDQTDDELEKYTALNDLNKKVVSDTTIQKKSKDVTYKELYENTNQEWKWWIAKRCPSGYTWTQKPLRTKKIWMPKIRKDDESTSISPTIDIVSRITNVLKISNSLGSNLSNVPSSSNSLADCTTHPIHCTVRFGNDQFAPILGYGDLIQGNVTIKWVYITLEASVTIFSLVGSMFVDADLEVALGNLMFCERILGKRFLTGTEILKQGHLHSYFKREGIEHQTFTPRTLEQNCVVERRNRTLVEAARTMLSASKLPLSFWAEASKGYRVYNKRTRLIAESIHIKFDEIKEMMSDHNSSDLLSPLTTNDRDDKMLSFCQKKEDCHQQGLEFLFIPLLEEYYNPTHGLTKENNNDQASNASFQEAEFINPFCTRVASGEYMLNRRTLRIAMDDSAWIDANARMNFISSTGI